MADILSTSFGPLDKYLSKNVVLLYLLTQAGCIEQMRQRFTTESSEAEPIEGIGTRRESDAT